jgi:hypothetical protein
LTDFAAVATELLVLPVVLPTAAGEFPPRIGGHMPNTSLTSGICADEIRGATASVFDVRGARRAPTVHDWQAN